jgi:hypothetical protein
MHFSKLVHQQHLHLRQVLLTLLLHLQQLLNQHLHLQSREVLLNLQGRNLHLQLLQLHNHLQQCQQPKEQGRAKEDLQAQFLAMDISTAVATTRTAISNVSFDHVQNYELHMVLVQFL